MSRIVIAWFSLVLAQCAFAQEPAPQDKPRHAWGVYTTLNLNWHTAAFSALPGVPNCCPEFQKGSGVGAAIGVLYEKPLSAKFALQSRLGYSWDGATLSVAEPTTVLINGNPTPGEFTHTLDVGLATIGAEQYIKYNQRKLFLQLGLRAGYVITKNYSQKEEITQPTDVGVFPNGERTRNVYSGTLPGANNFYFGLVTGLGLEFPINQSHTWYMATEAMVGLGFTSIVPGLPWNGNVVRLGLVLKKLGKNDEESPMQGSQH